MLQNFYFYIPCISKMEWNPQTENMLAVSNENRTKIWNTETGECVHEESGEYLTWSPDGDKIATKYFFEGEESIILSNRGTIFNLHENARNIKWNPTGVLYALHKKDNKLSFWQSSNEEHLFDITLKQFRPFSWSPKKDLIALSSGDDGIQLWDTSTRTHLYDLKRGPDFFLGCCLKWNNQETLFFSLSNNKIKVFDSLSGQELAEIQGDSKIVRFEWNQEGNKIITISMDKMVRIYEINAEENKILEQLSLEQLLMIISAYDKHERSIQFKVPKNLLLYFDTLDPRIQALIKQSSQVNICPICTQNQVDLEEEKWAKTPCCKAFICTDDLAILRAREDGCPSCRGILNF